MKWISPKNKLPPQGTKILCWNHGDCWIAQRFKQYWFPIPFCDSMLASYDAPELWRHIEFPDGFTGKMLVGYQDKLLTVDEIFELDHTHLNELIESMRNEIDNRVWRNK